MTDEQQIRGLIEVWATAVHAGDLPAVLANHAPDIVMFDVPPPERGVRGIDAYRDTWPGFFEWQSSGAVFEIESLDVTAGAEVAFAFALLRCGTPADFKRDPEQRLRLTIGLSKGGRPVAGHPRTPLVRRRDRVGPKTERPRRTPPPPSAPASAATPKHMSWQTSPRLASARPASFSELTFTNDAGAPA